MEDYFLKIVFLSVELSISTENFVKLAQSTLTRGRALRGPPPAAGIFKATPRKRPGNRTGPFPPLASARAVVVQSQKEGQRVPRSKAPPTVAKVVKKQLKETFG